jgi:site-specific DNA-methyltransferase (adenine-specific)
MIYVFSKKSPYYKRVDVKTDKKEWTCTTTKPIDSHTFNGQANITRTSTKGGTEGMRCPLSVINMSGIVKKGNHPTEKPEALYRWLLERYCPAGGTVLDPTAGSCNSVFVAEELGLNGIGIEKDKDFFLKAVERSASQMEEYFSL